MFIRQFRPLYSPDGQGTNGEGAPDTSAQGTQQPAATQTPAVPADPAAAFTRLLERNQNDGVGLARQLYQENYQYRQQLRDLQGQLPAAGTAVLTPEQAQAWNVYQQIGAPDAVRTALTERQQLQAEIATLRQEGVLRDIASIQGYDLDVLRTVGGTLTYVIKDETKDGKAVKVVYVTSEDGTEIPITQVAQQKWGKFLPALQPQATTQRSGTPLPRGALPPVAGQGTGQNQNGQQPQGRRKPTTKL